MPVDIVHCSLDQRAETFLGLHRQESRPGSAPLSRQLAERADNAGSSAIKDASDVLRAPRSDGNANMLLIRMSYRRPP
ncbi:hypothetical protein NCS52_01551400 [Fusarium sp. LHS14.1]|nr:hypothetical protein NCS52_01551400 [Fusarium sp. LHS14.1]